MTFEMLKRQHSDAQMPGRRKKRVKGIADDLWMGAVCLFPSLLLSLSLSQLLLYRPNCTAGVWLQGYRKSL